MPSSLGAAAFFVVRQAWCAASDGTVRGKRSTVLIDRTASSYFGAVAVATGLVDVAHLSRYKAGSLMEYQFSGNTDGVMAGGKTPLTMHAIDTH